MVVCMYVCMYVCVFVFDTGTHDYFAMNHYSTYLINDAKHTQPSYVKDYDADSSIDPSWPE